MSTSDDSTSSTLTSSALPRVPDEQHAVYAADPVAVLDRWESAGGIWRVIGRRGAAITISLRQCDGGAEADRLTSTSTELERYLGGRTQSDDLP